MPFQKQMLIIQFTGKDFMEVVKEPLTIQKEASTD